MIYKRMTIFRCAYLQACVTKGNYLKRNNKKGPLMGPYCLIYLLDTRFSFLINKEERNPGNCK